MLTVMIQYKIFFSNGDFILFTSQEENPFPFNLDYSWRIAIAITTSIVLFLGIFFRVLIFGYLSQPEAKVRPINNLIWIDQLNGLFSAVNISGRIVTLFLPFPLSDLTGGSFCKWSSLPGKSSFYKSVYKSVLQVSFTSQF
jgi:hypothetical protein